MRMKGSASDVHMTMNMDGQEMMRTRTRMRTRMRTRTKAMKDGMMTVIKKMKR